MKAIQAFLQSKQQKFGEHPFFRQLHASRQARSLDIFAPRLAFWVMAFQDVLRLNERYVVDPRLRSVVSRHRREDSGHDVWFLHDMQQLGVPKIDAFLLFGAEHQRTRDAAYLLVAEALQLGDDALRVALVLILEAAGHVFFKRVSQYVHAKGLSQELKYFSQVHYDSEMSHDLFAESCEAEFAALVLSDAKRCEVMALTDRCFGAFDQMFDGLMVCAQDTACNDLEPALSA